MSMIIGKALIAGGGGTVDRLDFTYTGQYNERLEDGVVEFLTTGVLKFKKEAAIDAFLCGGGAGGSPGAGSSVNDGPGGKGGSGGKTATLLNITPRAQTEYQIVIGVGGTSGNQGGDTSAFGSTANGGTSTAGGSGGGGNGVRDSVASWRNAGNGGSDGANGGKGGGGSVPGGTGQGTTTREFAEATGKLYAGGGGGGRGALNGTQGYSGSAGDETAGDGGGNDAPLANRGGGGGGGRPGSAGGTGGSGIVCIRLHKSA